MPTDLLLIGAGGSAREIADAIADVNRVQPRWNLLGFLDDDPAKLGCEVDGLPVRGPTTSIHEYPRAQCLIGVSSERDSSLRRHIVARLGLPTARYATIVHPSACISPHAVLGPGTVVLQGVVVTTGSVVGQHVLISQGTVVGHDVIVGDYVWFSTCCTVAGCVRIGEAAYIGAAATIAPTLVVGAGALVGIGSLVLDNVKEGCTVFGTPARVINASGSLRRWAR